MKKEKLKKVNKVETETKLIMNELDNTFFSYSNILLQTIPNLLEFEDGAFIKKIDAIIDILKIIIGLCLTILSATIALDKFTLLSWGFVIVFGISLFVLIKALDIRSKSITMTSKNYKKFVFSILEAHHKYISVKTNSYSEEAKKIITQLEIVAKQNLKK